MPSKPSILLVIDFLFDAFGDSLELRLLLADFVLPVGVGEVLGDLRLLTGGELDVRVFKKRIVHTPLDIRGLKRFLSGESSLCRWYCR